MSYIPRTDKTANRDHVHSLVREEFTYRDEHYLYRCTTCEVRFKKKTGVMVEDLKKRIQEGK
jgi:hypothetical protein